MYNNLEADLVSRCKLVTDQYEARTFANDNKPTKEKIDLAKKLNIKIILEKEWNKILDS